MHKNEFSKKRNISFAINAIKITPTSLTEPNINNALSPSTPKSTSIKPHIPPSNHNHYHTRNININTTYHTKSFINPTSSAIKVLNTSNNNVNTHSHKHIKNNKLKRSSPSKLLFTANQKLLNRIYKIPKTLSTQLNILKKQKQHLNLKQYQDKLFLIAAPQLSKDLRCKLDKSFYKLRRRNDKQYDNNYNYIKHIEHMEQLICNKINYKERMLKTFLIENNYVKPLSLDKCTNHCNSNSNSKHNRTHSNYYYSHTKKIMELPQLKIRKVIMNAVNCVHNDNNSNNNNNSKKQLTQRQSSVKLNMNNNNNNNSSSNSNIK